MYITIRERVMMTLTLNIQRDKTPMREINFLFSTNSIRHTICTFGVAMRHYGCCVYRCCTKGVCTISQTWPINGARKSLYKCIRTKAKCMFLVSSMLARTNHFGWWSFIHTVSRHGQVGAHRHRHRDISAQHRHILYIAGDKIVYY